MFKYAHHPFEYRLNYNWDAEHWTCICSGDPVDICQYINKHLEEMRDAAAQTLEEKDIAECFVIKYYYGNTLFRKWVGSADGILKCAQEIADKWLSEAFI